MSTRAKTILCGAMLAGIVLAFGVWWLAGRARRAIERELGTLQTQGRNLAADLRREEQRIVAAERAKADLAAHAVKDSGSSAPASAPKPAAPVRSMSDIIAKDPMLEVLELRRQRAAVMQDYGEFFQEAGLSAAQIEAFVANRMRWVERGMDLKGAAQNQDAATKETIAALNEKAQAEHDAAQTAILGAELYARMREYERTIPTRNILVRSLAGAAALAAVPLTRDQGDRLLQAALDASRVESILWRNTTPALSNTFDWDALDARARQILTPEQFALFTTMAPPSGFETRWGMKFSEALHRARAADAAAAKTGGGAAKPGGG